MAEPAAASAIFDQVFLSARARVLEVAAILDRLDRAPGFHNLAGDARFQQLRESMAVLLGGQGGRAERIQQVFSDPYDPEWVRKYQATGERVPLNPTTPH